MNSLQRYAIAAGAVVLATLGRWLVDAWLGDFVPFVTYFAAVALVGLYAGLGPGILTAILSGLSSAYLFTPPRNTIALEGPEHWVGLALFFMMSALIISLTEQVRRVRERRARELEETNVQKDQMISTLAHELRNPLAAIVSATEVAQLNDGELSSEARYAFEVIDRQSTQLKHLVDKVLDVARFNSGRITLNRATVDLAEVARECVETARSRCNEAGVELSVSGVDKPAWVHGDRIRLVQVLTNLLDNACNHVNGGDRITLALEHLEGHYVLRVTDTGAGIDPAKLEHLFEAFSRITPDGSKHAGGLGLGLHLVKRLVEKHDGSVRAHSDGLGFGAEFVIALPAIAAPPPEPVEPKQVKQAPGNVKVLIIDDNVDAARLLRMLLNRLDRQADVAESGEEGLERAMATRPDVIFVDLLMPGMDGFEVARRLREQLGSSVRLIALTGLSQQRDRDQALAAGFDDLIVKPATAQVLLDVMGTVPA